MGFAAHGAELRCFAAKNSQTVENDREKMSRFDLSGSLRKTHFLARVCLVFV
jgi:hypothetical protein